MGSATTRWAKGFAYCTIKRAGDGATVGGVGELDASTPTEVSASWGIYFRVDDCDASAAKAVQLGASTVRQPFDTPIGRMAPLVGPQGEKFSLIGSPE